MKRTVPEILCVCTPIHRALSETCVVYTYTCVPYSSVERVSSWCYILSYLTKHTAKKARTLLTLFLPKTFDTCECCVRQASGNVCVCVCVFHTCFQRARRAPHALISHLLCVQRTYGFSESSLMMLSWYTSDTY